MNNTVDQTVTFTRAGAWAGAVAALPVVLGSLDGIVIGVLSRQVGLSLLEAVLMSLLVFAGSAQAIALSIWTWPVPVFSIVLTTLVINLRYLLLSAALRPWFARLRPTQAYSSVFVLADENWALLLGSFNRGNRDAAFLPGAGLAMMGAWVSGTAIGYLLGALIGYPAQWGLDFIFTAMFVGLLAGMWRGKSDLLPWVVAALVAVVAKETLGGQWYILLGGLSGSLLGAWRDGN